MSESKTQSVFATLYSIDVRDKVEEKNGIRYMSWANAWAILKSHYPDAKRVVYECESTGNNYFHDGRYAWVKVGVTINGSEEIDYLPVLDYRNKPIALDNVNSFDVNKAIQRSTAKAIALHGLGLSLWIGEDLPSDQPIAPVAAAPKVAIPTKAPSDLIKLEKGTPNWEAVMKYVAANKQLGLEKICDQLKRKYSISPAIKKLVAKEIEGAVTKEIDGVVSKAMES